MLAWGHEGGQAIVYNARLARRFRAVSYKLATTLELGRWMCDSVTTYTQ